MWNDKEADLDLLGHRRIAQTIINIMDEQELRPLTIGVYGHWGIGKSSVLSLINQELKEESDTLVITFNGWLFQGYEDTKSALMESVVGELMRSQPTNIKLLKLGKSLLKRINWLKVAKTAGSLALTTMTGLPNPSLFGLPGVLKQAKEMFSPKDEGTETKIKIENDEDSESYLKEAEETVPGQIHAFREELRLLIKSSKVSRLVILVDELDRCLPAAVIDILEAIRLFLFVEGTVFVLAADEQMIEYAVRRHFPDLPVAQSEYTKHYLEKLVQVPIRVPSLNQLQTKNYVRSLLLQYELKNDKAKLREISEAFDASKANPYDNKDFTYEFICEQLGAEDLKLKTAMIVAEQLGAVLAMELRGNPRNIKRFLNTIFLRLRVAAVYKITDKVHLDVLSKLMILERFHPKEFERLIDEVSSTSNGRSTIIADLEKNAVKTSKIAKRQTASNDSTDLSSWARLSPPLKEVDLKPYLFISSERAVVFESSEGIPEILKPLYEALFSGNKIAIAGLEKDINALTLEQADFLFDNLIKNAQGMSDWSTIPPSVSGILILVNHFPSLEERFVTIIDALQTKKLASWMLANMAGIKTPNGIKAKKILFSKIASSLDAPAQVKSLAESLSNLS